MENFTKRILPFVVVIAILALITTKAAAPTYHPAFIQFLTFPAAPHKTLPTSDETSYKSAMTTLFWVGEDADADNDYIPNDESYWDSSWQEHFGGVDDPESRCGFHPCSFVPKENPFYFALPYGEFEEDDTKLKTSAQKLREREPLLKNRWIEVTYNNKKCYGQWQDVGPGESDDFEYVFGPSNVPTNRFGVRAGLDISPALWSCLGLNTNAVTRWRFVETSEVPAGPWRDIITRSGIDWD